MSSRDSKRCVCAQAQEQQTAQAQHDHDMAALQRMAQRAGAPDRELEPDNAFTCRLTMEVHSPARLCSEPHPPCPPGVELALEQ